MNTNENTVNKLPRLKLLGWPLELLIALCLVVLVYYSPWIVDLFFALALIVWGVLHIKGKGVWSALREFFKDIIWGLG